MTEREEKMQRDPQTLSVSIRGVWDVPPCLLWWFLIALGEMEEGLVAMVRSYLEGLFTEVRGYYWRGSESIFIFRDLSGKHYTVSAIIEQDIFEPRVLSSCYSLRYRACAEHVPGDFSFDSTTMTRVSVRQPSYRDYFRPCVILYDTYTFREHIEIVPPEFQLEHYFEKCVKIPRTKIQKGGMRMKTRTKT